MIWGCCFVIFILRSIFQVRKRSRCLVFINPGVVFYNTLFLVVSQVVFDGMGKVELVAWVITSV
jgi:hypothetical protein